MLTLSLPLIQSRDNHFSVLQLRGKKTFIKQPRLFRFYNNNNKRHKVPKKQRDEKWVDSEPKTVLRSALTAEMRSEERCHSLQGSGTQAQRCPSVMDGSFQGSGDINLCGTLILLLCTVVGTRSDCKAHFSWDSICCHVAVSNILWTLAHSLCVWLACGVPSCPACSCTCMGIDWIISLAVCAVTTLKEAHPNVFSAAALWPYFQMYFCVCECFDHMCTSALHVCSACRRQKERSECLGLEIQTVVSYRVVAGNGTQVLQKSSQCNCWAISPASLWPLLFIYLLCPYWFCRIHFNVFCLWGREPKLNSWLNIYSTTNLNPQIQWLNFYKTHCIG